MNDFMDSVKIKPIAFKDFLNGNAFVANVIVSDKQFVCRTPDIDGSNQTFNGNSTILHNYISYKSLYDMNIKEGDEDGDIIEVALVNNPYIGQHQILFYSPWPGYISNFQMCFINNMLDEYEKYLQDKKMNGSIFELAFDSEIKSLDEIKEYIKNNMKNGVRKSKEKIVGETLDADTIKRCMIENLDIGNCSEGELYEKKKVYYEDEFYKNYLLELFPDFGIDEHEEKSTKDNNGSKTNTGLVFSGNDFGSINPEDITTNMRNSAIGTVTSAIDESRKNEIKQ